MPLPLPNLDDRTFEDLVAEARAMISRLAPNWTNHNPADPGITLIELFAWLTELLLYRINLVPEANYRVFLELIGITSESSETMESAVARGLRSLQARSRAVSPNDFEHLALESSAAVARAKALADRNLEGTTPTGEGHVSVVILPHLTAVGLAAGADCVALRLAMASVRMTQLRQMVAQYLEPRRLLTTVVHVVSPRFRGIDLRIRIAERPDVPVDRLRQNVDKRLRDFLDPYVGGADGKGWPFGRSLHRFEIYQQVEAVEEMDHVESLALDGSLATNTVAIEADELICLETLTVELA